MDCFAIHDAKSQRKQRKILLPLIPQRLPMHHYMIKSTFAIRFGIIGITEFLGGTLAKGPLSVQVHQDVEPSIGGFSLPITFFSELDIAPGWDYVDRDVYLRDFWTKFGNDMLQSVLATVIAKVETQNWELEGPEKLATMYHRIIRDEADFHRGYGTMIARGVLDYYTQDNGWFIERQRSGPKDHDGPMLGISHLDSARMRSTGNAEYPYTYCDVQGEYHLMHRSQLIRIVDMPTPRTDMYGAMRGFCALSRTLSTSMIMTMLVTMKRERLADLPPSALAIFNNINRKQFEQALSLKGASDDMAGNIIWRQLMPLFGIDPAHPASVQFLSLREVWENYDDATQFDIAAYSYAAGFRIDPREFWPVSQGPMGTGKEAEIQHQKAKAKSHGLIFTELERALNADESLPKGLRFKFVLQDADEEQQRAAIHQLQIGNVTAMQEAGAQLTPDEVRHLLTAQYKVIPQIMAAVPEEGVEVDLATASVYMDDVERQTKEYGGLYFGPIVVIDTAGGVVFKNGYKRLPLAPLFVEEKGECRSGEVDVVDDNPIGGEDGVGSKEALLIGLKEQFVCCESHAFQMFPDIVRSLHTLNYLTDEQVDSASLIGAPLAWKIAQDVKQMSKAGVQDLATATASSIVYHLANDNLRFGDKESRALKTINQKIATLPRPMANQIRRASTDLVVAMRGKRRMQAIKDVPDEVWDEAVAKDELDEQPEMGFKGGPGSGNWGHAGRPGLRGGSGKVGGRLPVPTDSRLEDYKLRFDNSRDKSSVVRAVKNLPQDHLDNVWEITTDGAVSERVAGDCSTNGIITLYKSKLHGYKNWDKGVVIHEIGHAQLFKASSGMRARVRGVYNGLLGESGTTRTQAAAAYKRGGGRPAKGFPSKYAMFDHHELFAESYAMYVRTPARLQRMSPLMYDLMRDDVFNGVEYLK